MEGSSEFNIKATQTKVEKLTEEWQNVGNSKPVARSLALLEVHGLLDKVEGHSAPGGLYPFSVRLKTGKYLTKATAIHTYVKKKELAKKIQTPSAKKGKATIPLKKTRITTKGKRMKEIVERKQASRSKRARTMDKKQTAKRVVPMEKAEIWLRHPERYDMKGVDTGILIKGKYKTI